MKAPELSWQFHGFDTLDKHALFALLKLRVDVFVVEQACAYPELDSNDTAAGTLHLLGYKNDELVAYARAMPPEARHLSVIDQRQDDGRQPVRIGRVVVAREYRGHGIAQTLMRHLIERIQSVHPTLDQVLAAQTSVQALYCSVGFVAVSKPYLEDGIEHIDMHRRFAPLISYC